MDRADGPSADDALLFLITVKNNSHFGLVNNTLFSRFCKLSSIQVNQHFQSFFFKKEELMCSAELCRSGRQSVAASVFCGAPTVARFSRTVPADGATFHCFLSDPMPSEECFCSRLRGFMRRDASLGTEEASLSCSSFELCWGVTALAAVWL